jgi:hypothetical protein
MEKTIVSPFDEYCKCGRLCVCAILHDKSFVYSVGYNNYVPHVNIFRKRLKCPSTHAEIAAIRRLINTRRDKTRKRIRVDLTVLRKTQGNEYALSKPCLHCIQLMRSMFIRQFINIHNVTYFDGSSFKTEPFNDLTSEYVSSGWNHYYDN